jgi:hypothetical protein
MIPKLAVPLLILAAVLLPLPFALSSLVFSVLLAVRPRGGPAPEGALRLRWAGPTSLRSPPR